jgi:hypothetical protein
MECTYDVHRIVHNGQGGRYVDWHFVIFCDGERKFSGVANTKREAKDAAKYHITKNGGTIKSTSGNSGNGGVYVTEDGKIYSVNITPPAVNASIVNGQLDNFEIINIWTDEFHRFTIDEILENELFWLTGLCFYDKTLSQQHELVVAQLKAWHVYLGGNAITEILSLHNLTAEQFESLSTKSWNAVTINKKGYDDGSVRLDWTFEF